MSELKKYKVALVGNPNSGKSTLFNALTGLNQKTSNFPGVTVDKKTGFCKLDNTITTEIIDLPGTYSLQPKSADEQVTCDVLLQENNADYPDFVVVVADATNLKRNLYLATQVIETGLPVIIALNMIDLADANGFKMDIAQLQQGLGVPVLAISARKQLGINELKKSIKENIVQPSVKEVSLFIPPDKNPAAQTIARYNIISAIVNASVKFTPKENTITQRIDKVLTNKYAGYGIFLIVLLFIFQSIFFIAAFPMSWIESGFMYLSEYLSNTMPPGAITDLLVNGVLAGLSGILVFIPQIALLFGFIAILEDTGYMARVSFIMDKLLRKFGLNGRSVIPLISGVACAVPAIMGTRTISNWKERLITILVTPLMSCSARLPVYTLLISFMFPATSQFDFFNVRGLMLLLLYVLGFVAALLIAMLLSFFIEKKEASHFIMELPVYRAPQWKNVFYAIYDKVKTFVFDAGKIIMIISLALWFLSVNGPSDSINKIEKKYAELSMSNTDSLLHQKAAEKLEASYIGILGKSIVPVIAPLGFDWKIGIALITSFAAREVFVGTMATIYSVGNDSDVKTLQEKMLLEKNPQTHKPIYSFATSLSLILFFAFAMQCMSTLAVVKRETNSWKWPAFQFMYMAVLAYGSSFIVYYIFS